MDELFPHLTWGTGEEILPSCAAMTTDLFEHGCVHISHGMHINALKATFQIRLGWGAGVRYTCVCTDDMSQNWGQSVFKSVPVRNRHTWVYKSVRWVIKVCSQWIHSSASHFIPKTWWRPHPCSHPQLTSPAICFSAPCVSSRHRGWNLGDQAETWWNVTSLQCKVCKNVDDLHTWHTFILSKVW